MKRLHIITIFLLSKVISISQTTNVFIDYTDTAELNGHLGKKIAWGDYNDDGWVDFFSNGGVFRNNEGISFTKVFQGRGDAIWGDYNNDGLLDFFSYNIVGGGLYRNVGDDKFINESHQIVPSIPPVNCRGATWGDFDSDGYLDLYISGYESPDYQSDYMYMNNRNGGFIKKLIPNGKPDPARGVIACDFDEDNDLDIYVCNYRLEANTLWVNDGLGCFSNCAYDFGISGIFDGWTFSYGFSIGAAWGDFDNDGDFDLFVGNLSHADKRHDRPMLYENLGRDNNYRFKDKTSYTNLTWQESYASPSFADFDNDGYLDLFYTTVYSGDFPVLYKNKTNFVFSNITNETGLSHIKPTYQAAFADFNNDGYLDLITGEKLYKNTRGNNNWLKVQLIGNGVNTNCSAIGTQVRVFVGDQIITRQVEGAIGEGNQNDLILHFGIDSKYSIIDSIQVNWTGRAVQKMNNILVNQRLEIRECHFTR